MTVEFAAIVHRDDVGVPKRGSQVGFAIESLAEFRVAGCPRRQDFERITTWEAGMLGEVNVGHPARSQRAQDSVTGEGSGAGYRNAGRNVLAGVLAGPAILRGIAVG